MVVLFVSLSLSALAADNGSSTAPEETLTETVSSSTAEIIEIPENRSVDSKTFRLTDGSFYVAHYNTGIHEKDESGNWQEIDNRLYNQDGLISTKDGKVAFPSKTSSGAELFSLNDDKYSVYVNMILASAWEDGGRDGVYSALAILKIEIKHGLLW